MVSSIKVNVYRKSIEIIYIFFCFSIGLDANGGYFYIVVPMDF